MIRPFRALIGGLIGLTGLALAGPAMAATNQPIAQTGGATATFNLLGAPFTMSVALDTTTGDITTVTVDPNPPGNPADPANKLTAVVDSPTRVKFETANGTTKVSVKAKKNSLSMGVRTAKLADLTGSNTWSADLFATGAATSVAYTVGADASGMPTFAWGAVTPAAGVTATELGTWNGSGDHEDDDWNSAGGRYAFDHDGFRKTLTIAVYVHTNDDGQSSASLRVTLTGRDIQRLPLDKLVGPHTWKGQLCTGDPATIDYDVATDGTVTVSKTSPTATVNTNRHGVLVKFDTGDKVSIQLKQGESGGDAALKIDRRGRSCNGTRATVADPKVNGADVSTTMPESNGSRDHSGNGKSGDDNGRGRGSNGGSNSGDGRHGDGNDD